MDDRLVEDTLFLACTRPATVAGVPIEAMAVNIILTGIVFLAAGDLLYLLIAPVLHLVFCAICKNDHNAFRLLFAFVETKGRARNVRLWGGSSCTPLPLRRRFNLKDVALA
ncbi:type IV secretion system protein VirB3 [Phenylobacterium sp. LjRoot219]|uniref:type IV secretion system protein VirB3 n=1 Tax=Phenylobacterium sp. LjRoot219 TaxID=3342283 RepID=UPI003ED16104